MRTSLTRTLVAALLLTSAAAIPAGAQVQVSELDPLGAGHTVRQIPFSDWLNAQGTIVVAMQGRDSSKPFAPLGNLVVVDYAGTLAAAQGLSYGFSATGTVKVTTLSDGTGEVLVNLDVTNALTYAFNAGGNLIFGYTAAELASNHKTPALSDGHFQAKYTVPDASHPELNLATVTFFGGGTITQIKFHTEGEGPLRAAFGVPEGTPGVCISENNGLLNTGGGGATADGYPAERVDVRVAGDADLGAINASPTGANAPASARKRAAMSSGQAGAGAAGQAVTGSWGQIKALYRGDKPAQ
jgi:hypothetical protein